MRQNALWTSLCAFFSLLSPVFSLAAFEPLPGDEVQYEVSVPTSTGIATKTIEAYNAGGDFFQIIIEQDNGSGRVQKRVMESPRPQIEAQYIEDLNAFCQNQKGELQDLEIQSMLLKTCLVTKDDRIFKQQTWWAAEIPFGIALSVKASPLHPKASTTTKLLRFKRGSLP